MAINYQDNKRIFHRYGDQNVIFEASNQDTSDTEYQYFGYISSSGSWIIQRFHIQEEGSTIIYEYSAGQTRTDYDAHWGADGLYAAGDPALEFTTFDQITASLEA